MDQKDLHDKEANWLLHEKYGGAQSEAYERDLERLRDGEPLDYVIGHTPFLDCSIDLSYKPLIPRNETEFWVEKVIEYLKKTKGKDSNFSVLDIFSGSGCIGVALLKSFSHATVDFSEVEPDLAKQIKKNLHKNNLDQRVCNIYLSDVYSSIPQKPYDVILANPPYLSLDKVHAVQNSVLKHEPHSALFAEHDGMKYIEDTIRGVKKYLASDGLLCVEMEPFQKESIQKLCLEHQLHVQFMRDQFKNIRVAWITRESLSPIE